MSNFLRILVAFGFVAVIAACSQQEEPVFVEEPVMAEPTSSKF